MSGRRGVLRKNSLRVAQGYPLTGGGLDDQLLVAFDDGVAATRKRCAWAHDPGFSLGRTLFGTHGSFNEAG
jgi:hypothetical protein